MKTKTQGVYMTQAQASSPGFCRKLYYAYQEVMQKWFELPRLIYDIMYVVSILFFIGIYAYSKNLAFNPVLFKSMAPELEVFMLVYFIRTVSVMLTLASASHVVYATYALLSRGRIVDILLLWMFAILLVSSFIPL